MKKLFIILSMFFLSCKNIDNSPAEFSNINTFVVFHIDYYTEDYSKYSTIYFTGSTTKHSTIIAGKGMFNIGDTVLVYKK